MLLEILYTCYLFYAHLYYNQFYCIVCKLFLKKFLRMFLKCVISIHLCDAEVAVYKKNKIYKI